MSYSSWSDFAYYNIGDIATYNTTAYSALQANRNVIPSTLAPNWAVVPSGGGGGTLNFDKPTTDLSIVGGNNVDISPQLGYATGSGTTSLPADQILSVGNSTIAISSVAALKWIDPSLVAPASPNIPIYIETDPPAPNSPPAVYRWLEAHWFKQDPNPALQQDKYFWIETGDGYTTLGSQWAGAFQQTINFDVENLSITTGASGAGTGVVFKNGTAPTITGNLYQDAAGDLFWNGTQLNGGGGVLASGITMITGGLVDVLVDTGVALSSKPIITLTFFNDGNVSPAPPPNNANPTSGEVLWYDREANPAPPTATEFYIRISSAPPLGDYYSVAWSLLVI
jgi:hypothetical protein